MKKFIFINDYQKELLKLKFNVLDGDCDWYMGRTRPIKATKQNIQLLKQFAYENGSDYTNCEYDCTGSKRTRYNVKIKKGKCWLVEHTTYDC